MNETGQALVGEECVELTASVQGVEIVATADVGIANPDLWHRVAPAGLFAHFGSEISASSHIDFFEPGTLAAQQIFGHVAEAAISGGIELDFWHFPGCHPWVA
jgi:hypothetical protein